MEGLVFLSQLDSGQATAHVVGSGMKHLEDDTAGTIRGRRGPVTNA